MKIYMFEADWYCKPCGEAIAGTLPEPTEWEREHPDSDSYPVAYDSSEGETDTPDHCANHDCEMFLGRRLTEDGIEYVLDAVRELALGHGRSEIVQQWVDFYDIANAGYEFFECDECSWEWFAIPNRVGHAWESCPQCGADDGKNCWDCGINVREEENGGEMCSDCRHTLCWDCTGGTMRSFNDIHRNGRKDDGKRCGEADRVL